MTSAVYITDRVVRAPQLGVFLLVLYYFDGAVYDYDLRYTGGEHDSDDVVRGSLHKVRGVMPALHKLFLEDVRLETKH